MCLKVVRTQVLRNGDRRGLFVTGQGKPLQAMGHWFTGLKLHRLDRPRQRIDLGLPDRRAQTGARVSTTGERAARECVAVEAVQNPVQKASATASERQQEPAKTLVKPYQDQQIAGGL